MEASEVVQQKVRDGSLVDTFTNQVTRAADVTKRSVQDLTTVIAQKAGFEQIGGSDDPHGFRDDTQISDHALWDRESVMTKSKSASAGWSSYQNQEKKSSGGSASGAGKVAKVDEEHDWGEWGNDWSANDKKK